MMHLAIGQELAEKLFPDDRNRFLIGCILPDAVPAENKQEINSHFIKLFDDNAYKWFDCLEFFERYKSDVMTDELYLGYYFHLIADNVFRRVLYIDLGLLSRRGEKGLFGELYKDYNILNRLLIKRYSLDRNLLVPHGFSDIKINEIYPFELEKLVGDINSDFDTLYMGEMKHFTMSAVENYVEKSVKLCLDELDALKKGGHIVNKYELAIENKYSAKVRARKQ